MVSIIDRLSIPVKLIGIGEDIEDLRDFCPETYIEALLATEHKTEFRKNMTDDK